MELTEYDEDCLSDISGDKCRNCFDPFDVVGLWDTGSLDSDKWQMGAWCLKHHKHSVVPIMLLNITFYMRPLPHSKSSKEPSPT